MSMRVERSTLDQVKKRFEANKKKMEEKQKDYDFEERMKELREEVNTFYRVHQALWLYFKSTYCLYTVKQTFIEPQQYS